MSTENPCEVWKAGDCVDHRRGKCSSDHNIKFCKLGKHCRDDACLKDSRRHGMLCWNQNRWENG